MVLSGFWNVLTLSCRATTSDAATPSLWGASGPAPIRRATALRGAPGGLGGGPPATLRRGPGPLRRAPGSREHGGSCTGLDTKARTHAVTPTN